MSDLRNKNALITGASGGIGSAIARRLHAAGAKVALSGTRQEPLERLANELGERAFILPCNLNDMAAVEALPKQAIDALGSLDILVNNAGGAGTDLQPTVDLSDEEFDLCIKWNLYSTFWGTRRALRIMLEKKWGRIINISSMEGKHGKPIVTAYTTAKHAINGMTKSVAREVGTEGVTVNAICPGLIVTDILQTNGPKTAEAMGMTLDEMIDYFTSESAIKRPNKVEEVAAVALLLASEAGAGITGTQLSVDGGTAQY